MQANAVLSTGMVVVILDLTNDEDATTTDFGGESHGDGIVRVREAKRGNDRIRRATVNR